MIVNYLIKRVKVSQIKHSMNQFDFSHKCPLESWRGQPVPFSENETPLDLMTLNYPEGFVELFNLKPEEAIASAKKGQTALDNSFYLGPYLFHCPGLSPVAISNFIFQNMAQSRSLLFYYFSSINLDYMSIVDACRFLFSRVAFSDNTDRLMVIFESFASAYILANPYINLSSEDLIRIGMAAVLASGFRTNKSAMPDEEFLSILENVKLQTSCKLKIIKSINQEPIPLFFSFTHFSQDPDYTKNGNLKKIGGMFKTKKDRYFLIEGYILKYYNDHSKKEQIGELDIEGTVSSYLPADKKEGERLVIKRKDGGAIGYKISKGVRKKSNHTEYIAYGNDTYDLLCWINTLNLVAFWKTLKNLACKKN